MIGWLHVVFMERTANYRYVKARCSSYDKYCSRLLYTNYGLLGLNDVALTSVNRAQYGCVFMDPLGGLKEIIVPFHYALSSKNGKRARDIRLLKKLKTFMREEDFDDEKLVDEVNSVCSEIKTNEIRLQILKMLIGSKFVIPEALQVAATCFLDVLSKFGSSQDSPYDLLLRQGTIDNSNS